MTGQAWGEVLVPPQRIHRTLPQSSFADTETPTRWEKLAHKHRDPRPFEIRGWYADSHLPTTNQSEEGPEAGLNHAFFDPLQWGGRLLTTPSTWGHTVLTTLTYCGPFCLAKQKKKACLRHSKFCLWGFILCLGAEVRFSIHFIIKMSYLNCLSNCN